MSAHNTVEKGLPTNVDAERFVLGSILLDDSLYIQAAGSLEAEDFSLEKHRRIFKRMGDLHERDERIDRITLANELMKFNELEACDGLSYLVSLDDGLPQLPNVDAYISIVKEKSVLRRIILASQHMINRCMLDSEKPEQILAGAEETLLKLGDAQVKSGLVNPEQILRDYEGGINAFLDPSKRIKGISTGFTKLDEYTGGMHPGELFILAARPSMGKCLAADAEIVLADGSVRTIEQICADRDARLLTLAGDGRLRWTSPEAFIDDGIKPVFRVRTQLGRRVDTTLTHPFLTLDGWRRLEQLKPGDVIAVPRTLPVFGTGELPHHSTGGRQARRSSSAAVAELAPCDVECVPEAVFRCRESVVAAYLNQLFADSGWATPEIGFAAVSERLARQVQHLLLRFGIIAALEPRDDRWELAITDPESIHTFAARIGTSGELAATDQPCPSAGHLYWDPIVSIEYLGRQQVYDLTIPETHNFIANDICVHNTAFALNIAQHVALKPKKTVAVFSLEMSKESLLTRLVCATGRVDSQRFRSGYLTQEERRNLNKALHELVEAPIYIDDSAGIHLMEMHAKLRRLQSEHGQLGLVIVDYLQLMSGHGRFENRNQEVSALSRGMKLLAKELHVPMLVLSQLSRAVETRQGDHRPQLSDLRESGSIEQDADVVGFIFREEVYNRDREDLRGLAELIIAKQRNGPVGTVNLVFIHSQTKFENRAEDTGDAE